MLLGDGQGNFAERTENGEPIRPRVGEEPSSIFTGDFNGDDTLDLATANSGSDDVSVLLGRGDGTFYAQRSFGVGDFPSGLTGGQFNNDNRDVVVDTHDFLDLATANFGSNNVSLLLGDGKGNFRESTINGEPNRPRAGLRPRGLVAANFDQRDSVDEIVAATLTTGNLPTIQFSISVVANTVVTNAGGPHPRRGQHRAARRRPRRALLR